MMLDVVVPFCTSSLFDKWMWKFDSSGSYYCASFNKFLIQSPKASIPNVCAMCFKNSESNNLLCLHCDVARAIWNMLFGFFEESWMCPVDLGAFLVINFRGFGIRLCGKWQCLQFYGVFGLKGILEYLSTSSYLPTCFRLGYVFVASLWVLANVCFQEVSLVEIQKDWKTLLYYFSCLALRVGFCLGFEF